MYWDRYTKEKSGHGNYLADTGHRATALPKQVRATRLRHTPITENSLQNND